MKRILGILLTLALLLATGPCACRATDSCARGLGLYAFRRQYESCRRQYHLPDD
jgi:hypothetical protein